MGWGLPLSRVESQVSGRFAREGGGAVAQAVQHVREFCRETFASRGFWLVCCAMGLAGLTVQLMNRSLFPLFDDVFTYARDISITCSALVSIALGLISLARPALLSGKRLFMFMLTIWVLGVIGVLMGLILRIPALLVLGACLFVTSRGWASISSNLAAVSLPAPQAVVAIAMGAVFAQLFDLIVRIAALPQQVCAVLLAVLVPVCLVCAHHRAGALADEIAAGPAATELSVTRPASYLPLTSNLYVCIILVQVAFGFALRFGEVAGSPSFGNLGLAFAGVLVLVVLALGGRFIGDEIVNVSLLALTAGFLLVIVIGPSSAVLANGLLTVGTCVFGVALNSTLVALAARNPLAALSIMGWGQGMSGLATTLGALLGTTANRIEVTDGHQQLAQFVALLLLALVAYMLFGLRGFSLCATIEGVVPPEPDIEVHVSADEVFAERCAQVASDHQLTPREAEVFEMLARGRNREYIEERLSVSRNTVKAHVKHIYAKLDIHSHQELIDLVEGKGE